MNIELLKVDIACGLQAIMGQVAGMSQDQSPLLAWLVVGNPRSALLWRPALPYPSLSGKVPILDFTVVNLRCLQGIR